MYSLGDEFEDLSITDPRSFMADDLLATEEGVGVKGGGEGWGQARERLKERREGKWGRREERRGRDGHEGD